MGRTGNGRSKKGEDGVEEGCADETGVEAPQYFGNIDLFAVDDVREVAAGQNGPDLPVGLPPGPVDFDTFNAWAKCFDPVSGCAPLG